MNATRGRMWLRKAGLGLAMVTLGGCQTWMAGMTLPSGRYLQHPPQYFPPSPVFPLQRELSRQEEIALQGSGGPGAQGALVPPPPAPVVPPPAAALPLPAPAAGAAPAAPVPPAPEK